MSGGGLTQINSTQTGGGVGTTITVVANYAALPSASSKPGKFYWVSTSTGVHLTGLYYSNGTSWEFSPADDITVVADYNALPSAASAVGQFYWCSAAVTHTTLFITFTDYPKGLYYSNGSTWEHIDIPIQATQAEVDAGTISDKWVTPLTFANASKWATKQDTLGFTPENVSNKSDSYTVSSSTTYASTKALVDGLATKITANTAIAGSTKTKITYDANGLVTSGADATTADIADSTNKRYVTDAQLTVIGNTSGTNTGDQTIALTGDVSGSGTGSFTVTIGNNKVTNGKMAQMAAYTVKGNANGTTSDPQDITISQLTLMLKDQSQDFAFQSKYQNALNYY